MAELCGCNDELIRPLYEASSTTLVDRNSQKEQNQVGQEHASNNQRAMALEEQNAASRNSTRRNSLNTPCSNSYISVNSLNSNNGNRDSDKVAENINVESSV